MIIVFLMLSGIFFMVLCALLVNYQNSPMKEAAGFSVVVAPILSAVILGFLNLVLSSNKSEEPPSTVSTIPVSTNTDRETAHYQMIQGVIQDELRKKALAEGTSKGVILNNYRAKGDNVEIQCAQVGTQVECKAK